MFDKFQFSRIHEEIEVVPLLSDEDEQHINAESVPDILPILPIRNTVLFPGVMMPITVGRDKSIRLIKEAQKSDKIIGVIAQKDPDIEDPGLKDLYELGTVAKIFRIITMVDGSSTVIIQGRRRFKMRKVVTEEPYLKANVELLVEDSSGVSKESKAMISNIRDLAGQIIHVSPTIPTEATIMLKNIESPNFLIHFIASNLNINVDQKQEILVIDNFLKKSERIMKYLNDELQMLQLRNEIQTKVHTDLDKQQREFLLHQQLKTIQEELEGEGGDLDVDRLRAQAKEKKWSKTVNDTFHKEVEKLVRTNPAAPDYSVTLNYLELLLELPWGEYTKDKFDLKLAKSVLDRDHFDLEKVKTRILEYLAVLKLKGDMKSPILCFVGPPGVGKTSLGKSIANSLKRKFVRMSLGGLRDEAEIRGHRKTYIGAMPGRIIQSLKKAKSSNPVFMLDEVDKVGSDFRGDPSSALLEVLDPEQNNSFYDNFLELEYDLSKVMFIATANTLSSVHPALVDRMEIIEMSGYSLEDKISIAKKHLIPRIRREHGLMSKNISLSKSVLDKLIADYTRESGVRNLEKRLAALMRNIAKNVASHKKYNPKIKPSDLKGILGPSKFEKENYDSHKVPGVATGLAWTSSGGEILFIEVALSKGKGKLTLTGNLGDVMKESASTALSFMKSHNEQFGIDADVFNEWDIHIHVPEGAIPKDGPSAGITMLTALTSAFTQRNVKPYFAMTGEITLRGKLLPVGGIKEKMLAARRAGIKQIVLCEVNRKDIEEINPEHMGNLKIHYVKQMEEALELLLEKKKIANSIDFTIKQYEKNRQAS